MPWAKIDDDLFAHEKTILAGNEAMGVWVRLLSWSAHNLTNGELPEAICAEFCQGNLQIIDRLFDAGLLDKIESGYSLHDYLHYNPRASKVRKIRKIRALQGSAGGSKTQANHQAKAQANLKQTTNPVPVPVPQRVVDPQAQSKEKASTESGDSARVFEHYRSLHALAKMGKKAQVKLRERFREKWTSDELIEAIDGAHKTPWNNGEETGKKWLDLDLILRDADQVRRFIENNRDPPELRGPRVTSINAHTAGIMGILAMAKKEEEKNARRREGQVSEDICGNGELLPEPANTTQSRGGVLAAPEILSVRRSADGHGSGHG